VRDNSSKKSWYIRFGGRRNQERAKEEMELKAEVAELISFDLRVQGHILKDKD